MKWSSFVTLITSVLAALSCLFLSGIPMLTRLPSKDEKPAFITTAPMTLENDVKTVLVADPTSSGTPLYYVYSNSMNTRLDAAEDRPMPLK